MRWQTTAVLAAILIALGAFYYVYEVRLGPEREKTEGRKGRVFAVEPADVTELEIKRPDATVTLKREGDGWQILAPVNARGDRGPIDETVTSIVTARMDREIEADPKSLGDFGLDKPTAEITVRLKDGKQAGLVLGAKSPTGVWVYAREAGKPAVFVVGDSVLRDSTRPAAEFRDKTVLAFEQREVTGLEIDTRDDRIGLEQADGRWKMTRPRPLPADTVTVRDCLEKLRAARVKECAAAAPRSLEPFGLDKPVRLEIQTGRDKDRATKTLLVGRADPAKKGVYAMRPGEATVMLIPDETWTAVPKNVAVLRDKSIVGFDRDKVTRVEIESPKGTVTLAKDGERWKITAPQALAADQVEAGAVLFKLRDSKRLRVRAGTQTVVVERSGESDWKLVEGGRGSAKAATVDNLLYALRALKWKTIAAPTGDEPAKYGIDAPTLEVTLLKADGSEAGGLLVGKREGEQAWVKVKASPAIYAVDAKQLGEAPKVPDDFKG